MAFCCCWTSWQQHPERSAVPRFGDQDSAVLCCLSSCSALCQSDLTQGQIIRMWFLGLLPFFLDNNLSNLACISPSIHGVSNSKVAGGCVTLCKDARPLGILLESCINHRVQCGLWSCLSLTHSLIFWNIFLKFSSYSKIKLKPWIYFCNLPIKSALIVDKYLPLIIWNNMEKEKKARNVFFFSWCLKEALTVFVIFGVFLIRFIFLLIFHQDCKHYKMSV